MIPASRKNVKVASGWVPSICAGKKAECALPPVGIGSREIVMSGSVGIFCGRGSKLPPTKVQASLRTPKTALGVR